MEPVTSWRERFSRVDISPNALCALGALVLVAAHARLCLYFEPPEAFWNATPLRSGDFDTHFAQASRFIDAMLGWGKIWSYDPSLLAGHPAGVLFDCDNNFWNLWTYALHRAGLPKGLAFNLLVIAAPLTLPLIAFSGARLLRFTSAQALLFAVFGSVLWFFDSQTHYFWWIGMLAWPFASYVSLIPLGLFYRYTRAPRPLTGVLTALALAFSLLVHPYSFFILCVPMGVLCVRAWPRMNGAARGAVPAIALFAVLANSYWLVTSLGFVRFLLDSSYFHLATPVTLVHDFLELALDLDDTALFMRTGVRFALWGAGLAGLWCWRREGDDRFVPLAAGSAVMLAEAYLGSYTPVTAQIQPYRFVTPATLFLALGAVAFITSTRTREGLAAASTPVRALLAILGVSALQLLAHDALYYFPAAIPRQTGSDMGPQELASPTGYPRHLDLRHAPPPPGGDPLVSWFRGIDPSEGRVLVEPPVVGERLAALVPGLEVMGGITERNVTHAYSNFFRRYPGGDASLAELDAYLKRYAVRWVVLRSDRAVERRYAPLLHVRTVLRDGLIAEVQTPTSRVKSGRGKVRASMNRISVNDTLSSEPVVLRYHWLDTLVCEPGCRVSLAPEPHDPIGFLRVAAPHPPDFIIRNAY